MDPLFERRQLVRNVHVDAKNLQRNIDASLLAQIRMKYEGVCTAEGYLNRGSTTIVEHSLGRADLIKGGAARMMGAGQADPQKIAAAQQQQIDTVTKQALPQWLAKRAQLERTLGTGTVDFDEELEAWLEDNVLRNYLKIDTIDPRYQQAIKRQINVVNNTTSEALRTEQFKKLLATAIMARPSRAQAAQTSGVLQTKIDPSGRVSIGKYTLDPGNKNEAFMIAMLQNLQQQGKI